MFCSPKDTWFRLLKQGALLVPMKAIETVRYGVLISTLGMDKALNAEHPRMRQSVCLHLSLARLLARTLSTRECGNRDGDLSRSIYVSVSVGVSTFFMMYLRLFVL